jgi:hypothetical protein
MAYTNRPFNYEGDLPNQVEHDLELANDNFEILGQAFVNNTPTTATAKNSDKVDGYHASQTPQAYTIPVSGPTGKLDVGWLDTSWLNVYTLVPYWRISIDETSGSRTNPNTFTVSRQLKYMTYGNIFWYVPNWGTWSTLWEMKINSPSTRSISGKIVYIDDNVYIYLNKSQIVSATGSGFKNVSFTLNLVAGDNLIQIVHNNSGGGPTGLDIEIDFDWTQIKFVPL